MSKATIEHWEPTERGKRIAADKYVSIIEEGISIGLIQELSKAWGHAHGSALRSWAKRYFPERLERAEAVNRWLAKRKPANGQHTGRPWARRYTNRKSRDAEARQ